MIGCNLSNEDIALLCGINKDIVRKWRNGQDRPVCKERIWRLLASEEQTRVRQQIKEFKEKKGYK